MAEAAKQYYQAISKKDLTELNFAISSFPDALHEQTNLGSWLHIAASKDWVEGMQELVRAGLAINTVRPSAHDTALHTALSNRAFSAARWLIDHGASVNGNNEIRPPLIPAIYSGSAEMVSLLIKKGADVSSKLNEPPFSPLEYAIERGNTEIQQLLLSAGATSANGQSQAAGNPYYNRVHQFLDRHFYSVRELAYKSQVPNLKLMLAEPSSQRKYNTVITVNGKGSDVRNTPRSANFDFWEIQLHLPGEWFHETGKFTPQESWMLDMLAGIWGQVNEDPLLLNHSGVVISFPPAWLQSPFCLNFDSCLLSNTDDDHLFDDGKSLRLLTAFPLFKEERLLEARSGLGALIGRFADLKVPPVVQPNRKNAGLG